MAANVLHQIDASVPAGSLEMDVQMVSHLKQSQNLN